MSNQFNTQINDSRNVKIINTAPVTNQIVYINQAQNVQAGNHNSMYNGYYDDSSSDESISNDDQDDQLFTCDLPLDDGRLIEISQTLSKDWKCLGESLKLPEDQLNDIRTTYSCKGLEHMSYQILQTWMKNNDNPTATICDLAHSFEEDEDTADKFKKGLYDAVLKPKRQPAIEGQLSKLAIESPNSFSQLVPK